MRKTFINSIVFIGIITSPLLAETGGKTAEGITDPHASVTAATAVVQAPAIQDRVRDRDVLLEESFDAGIPPDWFVGNGGSSADTWEGVPDFEGQTLDGTPFAMVWDPSGSNLMEEELMSPHVDAGGYPEVTLEFDQLFYSEFWMNYGQVWVWDGDWVQVYHVDSPTGGWGTPEHVVIDLTPYANPLLTVDFFYHSDPSGDPFAFWAVDNVTIEGWEPAEPIVYGTVVDPDGVAVLPEYMYIRAHPWCHPWDTLTSFDGTIMYWLDAGTGHYQLDYTQFQHPCGPGDMVNLFFLDEEAPEENQPFHEDPVWVDGINPVQNDATLSWDRQYWFQAMATEEVTITVPKGKKALAVIGEADYDGHFSVKTWNSDSNKYVESETWDYENGASHHISGGDVLPGGRKYKVHNNNDDVYGITITVSELKNGRGGREQRTITHDPAVSLGGKDGFNCEFGDIVDAYYFYRFEPGCGTGSFPQVLGPSGVGNLEVEFDSYDNVYWWDLRLQIDLIDVSGSGTLFLEMPDADIPVGSVAISPTDDDCFFYPGGIWTPGVHSLHLYTDGILSFGVDCFNLTSNLITVGELEIVYEPDAVTLSWTDPYADPPDAFRIFSSSEPYSGFSLLASTWDLSYTDPVADREKRFYLVLRSLDHLP